MRGLERNGLRALKIFGPRPEEDIFYEQFRNLFDVVRGCIPKYRFEAPEEDGRRGGRLEELTLC